MDVVTSILKMSKPVDAIEYKFPQTINLIYILPSLIITPAKNEASFNVGKNMLHA